MGIIDFAPLAAVNDGPADTALEITQIPLSVDDLKPVEAVDQDPGEHQAHDGKKIGPAAAGFRSRLGLLLISLFVFPEIEKMSGFVVNHNKSP